MTARRVVTLLIAAVVVIVIAVWLSSQRQTESASLVGDTVFPGPSGRWVTFMRSYPNSIPMSAAVVERLAAAVSERDFDRIYGNFGNVIRHDARDVVLRMPVIRLDKFSPSSVGSSNWTVGTSGR